MMTPGMMRLVREQRLGFVATVNADGTPNLSPKSTFAVSSSGLASRTAAKRFG